MDKMFENFGSNELILVVILVLVGLSLILHFVSLIKITQIENGQKNKVQNYNNNSGNDGKKQHGNQSNKNKKNQDNRANQNNNRPAQQPAANQNKAQQNNAPEKKFEKIVSNAPSLKDTNAQLATRSKNQQGKLKVYSERPATSQKQERPANVPIKQQDLPKSESEQEKKRTAIPEEKPETNNTKVAEAKAEIKNEEAGSVRYGRR
jgi:hypothetical protein